MDGFILTAENIDGLLIPMGIGHRQFAADFQFYLLCFCVFMHYYPVPWPFIFY